MKHTLLLLFLALGATQRSTQAQGTLTITFDGPWPSGGADSEYKSYQFSGVTVGAIYDSVSFANDPDRNGYLAGWYNGGDGALFYIPAQVYGPPDTYSLFGVSSIDLSANPFGFSDFSVDLVGYRSDGSRVGEYISGTGTEFQTYTLGSEWSSGLYQFAIFSVNNGTWAADNLVLLVPEPPVGVIAALGGVLCCCHWLKRRRHVSRRQPSP